MSDGSDIGAFRVQTAFNIRERGGRRKQKPVFVVYFVVWTSLGCFGIWGSLGRPHGLESRSRIGLPEIKEVVERVADNDSQKGFTRPSN